MIVRIFITLCLLLPLNSVLANSRVALVIGNNNYADAPLTNPINDAKAISGTLQRIGFQVIHAYNVNRDSFEDRLAQFGAAAERAEIALIYYAGHAIQVDGQNYMIPANAKVSHRRDLRKLINLNDMVAEAQLASGLGLVLVDACRDNPFPQRLSQQMGRSIGGRGLARVENTPSNVLVGFATKDDEIAQDGVGHHNSPYARALLEHLPKQNLEVRRLFGYVRDTVLNLTNQMQKPFTYGTLGGEAWYLAGRKSIPSLPTPNFSRDKDADGINDSNDLCPATILGDSVNEVGCAEIQNVTLHGVNFRSGSARLTSQSLPILDEAANKLMRFPQLRVEVAGHTDSAGGALSNKRLSQRRADSVRTYLVSRGVNADNISAVGYGETKPITANTTAAGRAQNRRIELFILR